MHRVIAAFALISLCARAEAQVARDSLIPDSRLFVRQDLYVLAGFAAATVAMFPLDSRLASSIRSDRLANSATLNRIEHTLDYLGGPAPLFIGGAMYVVGRVGNMPRVAHLALHTSEAVLVGYGTSGMLKLVLGRTRPYVASDTNPRSFAFARGLDGNDYQSFPSGHTTTSFAVAAAVTGEVGAWWPRGKWIVGSLLFGGATLVGVSRMYDDKHWASDVVMGAAVGTFAGLKTVRFNHTRTGNRIDRWLLGTPRDARIQVTPAPDGSMTIAIVADW